jgi:PAS domain S-box-containing protein
MIPAPLGPDEAARLVALRELAVLDTTPEERFDRLTRLARDLFGVPIALVSLVDEDRQWFKSRQGLAAPETSREVSFCAHAILDEREVLVVPDALRDERFADNPLVTGDPDIRFYAGAPLSTADGHQVGTLCVIDRAPREWTAEQSAALRDLADVVEAELERSRVEQHDRALVALTSLTTLPDDDRWELLRSALALGCQYLGMQQGIISRITGDDYEVAVQASPPGTLTDGQHFALADTYCDIVLSMGGLLAIEHTAKSEHATHPAYALLGLESYVGAPIEVDGAVVGTLNFSSVEPRQRPFTSAELDFVRLLVAWAASVIQRFDLDDELQRQQALNWAITRAQATFIAPETRNAAFESLLLDLLDLTGCEYGFIGEVLHDADGLPYLKTRALTNIAWNEATHRLYEENVEAGLEFRNLNTLFGVTLRTGKHVLANDPYGDWRRGGLPADHPPMNSYLGLPVFHGGEFVGMVGLANMPGGFTEAHVSYLQPLLSTLGQLIDASTLREQIAEDQSSIARLSQVASQSPNGVVLADISGRIEWVNEGFRRITGYALEEVVGRRPRDFLHGPGTPAASEQSAFDAMSRLEPFSVEIAAVRKDETPIWVEVQSTPLLGAGGGVEGYLVMVSDISERKSIERLKNQFISTVSHELRTPLTAITGALGLIAGGVLGDLPDEARAMVGIAQTNSQRLTTLINDLLDMERLVEGGLPLAMQVQPVMPIIDRAVSDNATYAARYGVTIAVASRDDEACIDVDALRLVQVLSNLLSNACKFAPTGTVVDVAVDVFGDSVRIGVRDRGAGIPESFRASIFGKFSQADASDSRERGGTGLGLAISKELTERMHGEIGFDSTPGQETVFHVTFPRRESDDGR